MTPFSVMKGNGVFVCNKPNDHETTMLPNATHPDKGRIDTMLEELSHVVAVGVEAMECLILNKCRSADMTNKGNGCISRKEVL